MSPSASRPWWRHPGPLLALLLHAVIFFGLFQLRFERGAWSRLEQALPANPTTSDWYHALLDQYGIMGLLTWFFDTHGEIRLYHRYAEVVLRGVDPTLPADAPGQGQLRLYQDVPMEYQPGALLMLVPPGLVAQTLEEYETAFTTWCGVVYMGSLLLGMYLLGRSVPLTSTAANRTLWSSALFLLCFGGVAAARFDHIVPLFCVLSIAAFARGLSSNSVPWFGVTGAMIAAGVFVKIVPGVVLPALLLNLVASTHSVRWRAAISLAAGFAITATALHAAFVLLWGDGYLASYRYHMDRGLQIESTYAGAIALTRDSASELATRIQYGAADLVTPLTGPLKILSPLLFLSLAAVIAARVWFGRHDAQRASAVVFAVVISTCLLLAFMLTNKVLSPQYLIWIAPLLALSYGARPALLLPVLALLFAAALSQALFPHLYDFLLNLHPLAVLVLNVRNLTLAMMLGWLIWRLPRLLSNEAHP